MANSCISTVGCSIRVPLYLSFVSCWEAFQVGWWYSWCKDLSSPRPSRPTVAAVSEQNTAAKMLQYTLARATAALFSVPVEVFCHSPPMVEPPAPSYPAEAAHRQAVQAWLETYDAVTAKAESEATKDTTTSNTVNADLFDVRPNPMTYGEVTLLGARQLFYYLGFGTSHRESRRKQTCHKEGNNEQGAVFVDLGMGKGKLVVQAFLEHGTSLQSTMGIELDIARYSEAVRLRQAIPSELLPSSTTSAEERQNELVLHQGDLFDLDLTNATHIYVASLCFTNDMMHRLGKKLGLDNTTIATQPHGRLRTVATLQPFPDTAFRRYDRMEYVQMTWTAPWGCPVYFYDWK